MRAIYLDSSAAVKLFKEEPGSADLDAWLAAQDQALVLTSDLTRTELRRALHADKADPDILREARIWLDRSAVIRLTPAMYDRAGDLQNGARLRSLDALHATAALEVGAALTAFVAYDERLLTAVRELGLPAVRPGA